MKGRAERAAGLHYHGRNNYIPSTELDCLWSEDEHTYYATNFNRNMAQND